METNADWSPYEGWDLAGFSRTTLSRGEVIVDDYKVVGKEGRGTVAAAQDGGTAGVARLDAVTAVGDALPGAGRAPTTGGSAVSAADAPPTTEDICGSPLWNPDLAPTPLARAPGPPTTSPRSGSA